MNQEDQDWVLAEAVLDLHEAGASVNNLGDVVSSVGKEWPTRRYRTAWKMFDFIKSQHPPKQAPALLYEVMMAMVVTLHTWGYRDEAALLLMSCASEKALLSWGATSSSRGVPRGILSASFALAPPSEGWGNT